jgi:SAM-dependent methyltransferase
MAIELKETYNLGINSFHIDIAGNDGTLLSVFQKEIGHSVLNIDPAENLCKIAKQNGINSLDRFWGIELGKVFAKDCDLITATNVFAHLDNVTEFLEACKIALKPNGVLVIENPYFPHTMETNQFDQVYFEHVSYWSLIPMIVLCDKIGLKVIDCKQLAIHGGSMRYVISQIDSDFEETEKVNSVYEYFNIESLDIWSSEIQLIKEMIITQLKDIKKDGKNIVGFAASAKGNTLMNYCGIDHNLIDFICDETPEKIGKYSPGTGIPIYDLATIEFAEPDYILILSWNFQDEIIAKLRKICPNSKYIVPIPEFKIIE